MAQAGFNPRTSALLQAHSASTAHSHLSATGLTQPDLKVSELARPPWQNRRICFWIYCIYCQMTFARLSMLPDRSSFRPALLPCSDACRQGKRPAGGARLAGERAAGDNHPQKHLQPVAWPASGVSDSPLGTLANPCANSAAACLTRGGKQVQAHGAIPVAHLPVVVFWLQWVKGLSQRFLVM